MTDDDDDAIARAELVMHLRRQNVAGRQTLAALESVPRSLFLGGRDKALAYKDRAAPIECGQTISQPTVVAMMTEALELTPECRVLEIGTGSGYQTAILAKLCREVISLERFGDLSALAAERLKVLGITNATLQVADGGEGWPEGAPYDRVLITASVRAVPQPLVDQLARDGILVAPVGEAGGVQELVQCRKTADGLEGVTLAEVRFVPMLPGVASAL